MKRQALMSNLTLVSNEEKPQSNATFHGRLLIMQACCSHLSPAHTDDAIDATAGIVEEGHGDGVFAGRQPIPFGGRVDLEDVSSGAEDGLLPSRHKENESFSMQFQMILCRIILQNAISLLNPGNMSSI